MSRLEGCRLEGVGVGVSPPDRGEAWLLGSAEGLEPGMRRVTEGFMGLGRARPGLGVEDAPRGSQQSPGRL